MGSDFSPGGCGEAAQRDTPWAGGHSSAGQGPFWDRLWWGPVSTGAPGAPGRRPFLPWARPAAKGKEWPHPRLWKLLLLRPLPVLLQDDHWPWASGSAPGPPAGQGPACVQQTAWWALLGGWRGVRSRRPHVGSSHCVPQRSGGLEVTQAERRVQEGPPPSMPPNMYAHTCVCTHLPKQAHVCTHACPCTRTFTYTVQGRYAHVHSHMRPQAHMDTCVHTHTCSGHTCTCVCE